MVLIGKLCQTFHGVVQDAHLRLLGHAPHMPAAMDPVVASLMAVLTQRHTEIVQALLDVVSITRAGSSAHAAWQGLDCGQVLSVFVV